MHPATQLADNANPFTGATTADAPEFAALRKHLPQGLPQHKLLLRYEAEAAWLVAHGVAPGLAAAAAARAASLFVADEEDVSDGTAWPRWHAPMAAEISPGPLCFTELFGLEAQAAERLHAVWGLLGTADALMETGGDIRLARDPKTALNGYGCSGESSFRMRSRNSISARES